MRAVQGREPRGQALLDGTPFPRLHSLPRFAIASTVEVWVPRAHLRDECSSHVAHVERAALLGNDRVKEHLQEDVAEFLANEWIGGESNRLVQLGGFLDQIRSQ